MNTIPNLFQNTGAEGLPVPSYTVRGFAASVLTNNRPESFSRGVGQRDQSFIESIEVLRGPSSILLGPVLPGGAINQVTKSPEAEAFVDVRGRAGSYDFIRSELDANSGSLFGSHALRGRITVAYESQGSPQAVTDSDLFAIRPVVEFDMSERTRLQVAVAYTEREAVPSSLFPVNSDGTVPEQITDETFFGVPSRREGEDLYFDGEVQHEFSDNLKLVVRGSYQDTTFSAENSSGGLNDFGFEPGDTDVFILNGRETYDEQVTYGDVQITGNFSAFDQRQDWVIGGTYQKTESLVSFGSGADVGVVDITDPNPTVFPPQNFDYPVVPFFDFSNELRSLYAEANIRPIEKLTVVTGVRYDEVTSTNIFPSYGISEAGIKNDDVTFRVGGSYAFTDGFNGYISYAESFIPQDGGRRDESVVSPETATNYEAGLKGKLFDSRVRIGAAIFSLTRQNVATPDPTNNPALDEFFVVSTGEQRHRGIELSAAINLIEGLTIDAAYGYVDIEVTKSNDTTPGNRVGDRGVGTNPDQNYSLFATYKMPAGRLSGLSVGAGVRGISKVEASSFEVVYPGYDLVDALVTYKFDQGPELQLNVLNLLNEEYRTDLGYNIGDVGGGHLFGLPRGAYLSVEHRF
jgi:iron complex outermembrane recepter protein